MIDTHELISYLDELLWASDFQDRCLNGLNVEGADGVSSIISGVSVNQELIDAAIKAKADAILVHHGLFWQDEDYCVFGIKKKRIKALLAHNINLIAYHLPLDYHPEFGNNAQLANILGIQIIGDRYPFLVGEIPTPISGEDLSKKIKLKLHCNPLHIKGKREKIEIIAWCSGAAQDYIEEAAEQKVDAYLTGEVSERAIYVARETGIHLFVAGHYATERYGVQALGEHLAKEFGIKHQFVEIENPI